MAIQYFPEFALNNYADSHMAEPERSRFKAAIADIQGERHAALEKVVSAQALEQAGFGHLVDDIRKKLFLLIPVYKLPDMSNMVYGQAHQPIAH